MTARVTPMLRQYNEIKSRYPDAIVFFRLGDFYEMFGDDAIQASRVLEITLTSREVGKGERIPMCGVPYHAADSYLATLVEAGFKVAVCDQLQDAREAKGVVHRDVTRVLTPGTTTLPQTLPAKAHRLLAALCRHQRSWGLAAVDASTGAFWATQIDDPGPVKVREELARLQPAEVLVGPGIDEEGTLLPQSTVATAYDHRAFRLETAYRLLTRHFQTTSLVGFGVEERPAAVRAAGAALAYVGETQRTALNHITRLVSYDVDDHMRLDEATRRNLELTSRRQDRTTHGTLLSVLDRTETAMGGRLLRRWIEQPLVRREPIERRLDAVTALVNDGKRRERLREALAGVADLERLLGRVAAQTATARDLQSLARSLGRISTIEAALAPTPFEGGEEEDGKPGQSAPAGGVTNGGEPVLQAMGRRLDPVDDVRQVLDAALADDLPPTVREGGLIRDGYDSVVDELRRAAKNGRQWISDLEARERERTGIRSLKVGYNKVFGYYLEVTRPNLDRVPPDFQRRQTLRHAERFITPALKEQEALVLGAHERLVEREYELFVQLRDLVRTHIRRIQETAAAIAELDALLSLAIAACEGHYVRPQLTDGPELRIEGGRHPVVEAVQRDAGFVANDTDMNRDQRLLILTGPNMAGKSTYLRQVGLIVLMAQIGSFVPADAARIGLVDRIFTRIGASDNLSGGESTFMVEMNETAYILHHATERSLVLLDELGRGTSTYDGVALAQAIAEHLHDVIRCKTIMSTHYHELTRLVDHLPAARNYRAAVQEERGKITFLYRILPGSADRSYGVNVARMAGLPEKVLRRARQVLRRLEGQKLAWGNDELPGQLAFFDLEHPRSDNGTETHLHDDEPAAEKARHDGTDDNPAGDRPDSPGMPLPSVSARKEAAAAAEAVPPEAAQVLDELATVSVNTLTPLQALVLIERWQQTLTPSARVGEGGR